MKRRALLALALFAPGFAQAATLTAADRADVARIERYLGTLQTLKARFLQVAPDGGTSEGNAWLQRPGRLRFEYDPPAPFLLVANHGVVVFHDRKIQQNSQILMSSTPLGILLADQPKLSGDVTVDAIDRQPGLIQVTLHRTGHDGDGSLTLVFADMPLQLRQWSVVDAQRLETRVSLFNIANGDTFDQKLFEVNERRDVPGGSPTR